MTDPLKFRDIEAQLAEDSKAEALLEARAKRRKLRKAAKRAHAEEGQETAYKGRWIRRAETGGIRKARKPDEVWDQSAIFLDSKDLDLSKLEPGVREIKYVPSSSFLLSEVEESK